ncbi:ATP-binding protein [Spirulina subsalsa FACHB-351]|uniref:ATP-binding protein n=1 Tax=Spirulina subsalsa FACHB-351 TaxID=234711 RepID=A0ABT3L9I1_9CYAN|nr:ATP-binding protein [Spirulina subsalsa]MCW6038159.1 ATP-binding protein [Spirulina subsalsa FACHB-351]
MTDEKLFIENFAGLKHINIDVKKINIFIGPQASGKSVVAKILFYCKAFIEEFFNQGIKLKTKRELDLELKNKFQECFPHDCWGKGNFFIRYSIGVEYIEIKTDKKKSNKSNLIIDYSDFYTKSFNKIRRISKRIKETINQQENPNKIFSRLDLIIESHKSFLEEVSKQFGKETSFSQLFIPAGRSFFAHLQNNIFSFLSENNTIDPFLVDFGNYYDMVKNSVRMNRIKSESPTYFSEVEYLKNKILVGNYLSHDGKDYLKMSDGRQVLLSNCSSGQQEALPLTLILESIPFFGRGLTGQSTYIEEPEAHLFPTAQKDIVDLMATIYNLRKDRIQFFITTHSPYILTSFNNLLQAGMLAKSAHKDQLKRIVKIVPDSRFLNTDDLAVYSLSNGTCHSIISSETGLIEAEIIDSVSQNLAIEFDDLLEI